MDLPQDFSSYLLAEMNQTDADEYVDLLLEICEYHAPGDGSFLRSATAVALARQTPTP